MFRSTQRSVCHCTLCFWLAQVQRWMNNHCSDAIYSAPTDAAAAAGQHTSCPRLELTVDSADQLPAAEAVIAAMYGMTAPMQRLTQVQLLAAALIADRIQVTAAVKQAVAALQAAAAADSGLSAAALEALASLPAWPVCLLPLLPAAVAGARCCNSRSSSELAEIQAADTNARVRRMLLAVLGNLDAVWADEQLKQILLALPLPAMQLLLSSDSLQVASEDTVLYTATQYMTSKTDWEARAAAQGALAPLVRCPQLSRFALMWVALSVDSSQMLLGYFEPHLKQLLSLRCVTDACSGMVQNTSAAAVAAAAAAAAADIEDAPASWSLAQRQIRPLESGARVLWRLPVEKLAQACRDSVVKQQGMTLEGPDSPPIGGVAWRMRIVCEPKGAEQSCIGGYGDIVAPDGIFYAAHVTLSCRQGEYGGTGGGRVQHELKTPLLRSVIGYGDDDFFGLGAMGCGGWDDEGWAGRGLPASGDLELEMVVHSVC
jgi:hypothetical protein